MTSEMPARDIHLPADRLFAAMARLASNRPIHPTGPLDDIVITELVGTLIS